MAVTSAVRAIIPPSPQLSARMTNVRYLTEMTMMSAQKMSERMPRTFAAVTAMPYSSWKDSRKA